jgi:molybdate transport system substrate-binding protein
MRLLPRLILCLALGLGPTAGAAERITVFGAASLSEALEELGATYEKKTGSSVRFSFAASSTLARQVEAGAPADLVALASAAWSDYLAERGLIRPGSRISPIGNRLALVAPTDSAAELTDPPSAAEVLAALGPHGRLAIGDPAHVPAGIYARQALDFLGLWHALASHLAHADNARAALALVAHGEAPLGIVYATDARAVPGVRVLRLLPQDSHTPILYTFAAVTGGNERKAMDFLSFLSSPEGLAIFARHDFAVR